MGRTKTFLLMGGLILIFVYIGNLAGGVEGMKMALWLAFGINFFSYFFSHKLILSHYKAAKADKKRFSELYATVRRLSEQAGLPMPRVYIIPESVPNAFATGRNPKHAAIAVTQGLLDLMTPQEIEGVLAHEMSHIRHYDILISSISAIFAGAITSIGNLAKSKSSNNSDRRNSTVSALLAVVLVPLAATIIRMSISRTREYAADEGAARLTNHPEWLISALTKLENYAHENRLSKANPQTAHLFIISPFSGSRLMNSLFSTHPSTADRIKKLSAIKSNLTTASQQA